MGASHKVLKTVLPDLLFDDSLTLYGKQTIVKLISYGDGHTPSDLFLFLPQEKIIFAGDLLFVDYHAWVGESKVDRWIDYLKKMQLLDVNVYIPGHGPEGNANSVATMIRYFEALNASVAKLKGQANLSNKEIDDQMPAEFKNWHLRMFYAFNIKYLLRN